MKRFALSILSLLLVICFIVPCFADNACTCNCNQTSTEETPEPENITPEQAYSAWFDLACSLAYSGYAQTTWLSNITYYDRSTGDLKYVDADLTPLLNEDILAWSAEDIEKTKPYIRSSDDNSKTAKNTFMFLNTTKLALIALLETHSTLQIPEAYKDMDKTIVDVINTLINIADTVKAYIEKNKVYKGFNMNGFKNPLSYEELESAISFLQFIQSIR